MENTHYCTVLYKLKSRAVGKGALRAPVPKARTKACLLIIDGFGNLAYRVFGTANCSAAEPDLNDHDPRDGTALPHAFSSLTLSA